MCSCAAGRYLTYFAAFDIREAHLVQLRCLVLLALALAFASGTVAAGQGSREAQLARFEGKWKEDPSSRKNALAIEQPLEFRRTEAGELQERRGYPINVPQWQTVVMDGKPRTLPSGNIMAWQKLDENTFERTLTDGFGRTLAVRRITLSASGQELTENIKEGQRTRTATFKRESGSGKDLVGVWSGGTLQADPSVILLKVEGSDRFTHSWNGSFFTGTLGGPAVQILGAPDGMTGSGRLLDDGRLETVTYVSGKELNRTVYVPSPDGKSLSLTTTAVNTPSSTGPPATSVWNKQ